MNAKSVFAWLVFLAWTSSMKRAEAGFEKKELTVPGNIASMATGDLDGDEKTDLVVSFRRGAGPDAARHFGVFFRSDAGYAERPDCVFSAPANAVMFDVGDVVGDKAEELVYLTSSGVIAQPFAARKAPATVRVLATPTLFEAPEEDDLVTWDFVRALLGDEPATMIVPMRHKLQLYRREDAAWKPWSSVELEHIYDYDAESRTYRGSQRGGASGRPYAVRMTTIVPNIDFVDQTGDGRVDLVAHFEDRISVYAQQDSRVLSSTPTSRQWMMVRTAAELENRDSQVSAQVSDLDGDGIADLAVTKIGGGVTTLSTEVRLYRGQRGGGFSREPTQSLRDDGFAALSSFVDVDGDGALEMVHPHAAVSIVSLSRAMLSSEVRLDLRIRKRGTSPELFLRDPVQVLDARFGLDLTVGATVRGGAAMFGRDVDGDGIRDAIVPDGPDKMVVHRGVRGGEDPFDDDGHIALNAPGSRHTEFLDADRGKACPPDVVVYYVERPALAGKLIVFRNTSECRRSR